MALWCRDLKTVAVERGLVPKHVTLVVPYYENPQFFRQQLEGWSRRAAWYQHRFHFRVVVVDDGSPRHHASAVYYEWRPTCLFLRDIRIFRIEQDVRWNWLAARNIGMHHAPAGWCLLTDMDHVVPHETLDALIYGVHDPRVVYCFARREHTGEEVNPHSASFFIHRSTFWKTGGYDEALSGYYGTDGDFRRRLAQVAPIVLTPEALVRHEYVGDSSTESYKRKQPEDAKVRQLIAQRGRHWTPRVLSFPYHEVTRQEVTC